ncbi:LysE family translocator [Ferruginibacter yonginensis]|uniref:LysE family translocator n=1 Tax=Ferruginibacter yonginensis TaxID=1310416 RepID=A0ABV8QSN7_9BACT
MIEAVIAGLLLGMALVFSVGPVIFTILKLRINYGITSALFFISGVWLSDLLWVVTANLFSSLLDSLTVYKLQIGTAGGIFLVALGIFYLFFKKYHSKQALDEGVKIGKSTHAKLFVTGFLINTLNPGVIALWLAAATKSISNTFNEKLVTFSICLAMNVGADIFKINLAGKLRKKLTDKNIVIVNKISGLMFLAFGIALIFGVWYNKYKPQ